MKLFDQIQITNEFFSSGGPVLFVIFIVSILLWSLLIERYFYLYFSYPKLLDEITKNWQKRDDKQSWYASKIRDGLLSDLSIGLHKNLQPIQTITAVLPLLGLLGTVTGMISIFDVLNSFGMGNAKGMADGISKALLPTTAGLVTAILGIYFSVDLKKRAQMQELLARDLLVHK